MVRLGGLEPPTSGATNLRSNQLSYNRLSCPPLRSAGEVQIRGLDLICNSHIQILQKTYPKNVIEQFFINHQRID